MRGQKVFAVALITALGACASANSAGGSSTPPTQTVQVSGMAGKLNLATTSATSSASFANPLDQVWKVLPAVLDSIGVPIATLDQSKHVIGNEGFKLRQRLGKVLLSRYLDCGLTQIGPNADSYEVVLTVFLQLSPGANNTTTMSTTIDASARPVAFNQAYSNCSSKGQLEARLLEVTKQQLAH